MNTNINTRLTKIEEVMASRRDGESVPTIECTPAMVLNYRDAYDRFVVENPIDRSSLTVREFTSIVVPGWDGPGLSP